MNLLPDFGGLSVDPETYDASRILVRFQSQTETLGAESVAAGAAIGEAPLTLLPDLRTVHLAPSLDVETALTAFRADPRVLYAEPDYRVHLAAVPDDSRYAEMWNLNNLGQTGGSVDADIDAPGGWDVTVGSGSTVVAVIDTGVNYDHVDLAANMWINPGETAGDNIDNDGNGYVDDVHGYDFANNDSDPMDDHGHGTHVAGTIGAVGDNGIGVAGINWNVQIMALKFLGADGSGSSSAAIEAINYAVANGAEISNNSWGGDPFSQAMFDAIAAARSAEHIFVTAAGNGDFLGNGLDNDASPFYPASYDLDNIIAVAAVDHTDDLAGFSNYGATSVDLAAPGVNILSTTSNGGYGLNTGTSMASPHVAGVTALVRNLNAGWSYDQVISQVLSTVDPLPQLLGVTATGGRLNMAAALGNPEPPIPPGPPGTLPILEDFTDGLADFFQPQAGNWDVNAGRYHVTPVADNQDLMAISTLRLDDALPSDLELQATLNAEEGRLELFGLVFQDYLTNSLLIFDYQGLNDFKFAGADIDQNRWVVGHFDDNGWGIDTFQSDTLQAGADYHVRLIIQDDIYLTLEVNGILTLTHSFPQPVNDGDIGLGMRNSISHFDNILLRRHSDPTPTSLPVYEDFEATSVDFFRQRAGVAGISEGRYELTPFTNHDAISTLEISELLPANLELQVTVNADDTSPDRFSNAFVIFDYAGPTDFKFAGAFVGADQWVIGHRDTVDWIVDAMLPGTVDPLTDYRVKLFIEDDSDVTLFVDGKAQLGYSFVDSLTDGELGVGTKNAVSRFDDLVVQAGIPTKATLPLQEDFQDDAADDVRARAGSWSVADGRLLVTPAEYQDGIGTLRIVDPLPTDLALRTTINADDRSPDRFSNAFVIFDYVDTNDFKFAGAFVGAGEWVIGRRDTSGWNVDAVFEATIEPLTDYRVELLIEDDSHVTLFVDGTAQLGHSFADSLTDGDLGLGTQNAIGRFDDLIVQSVTPLPPGTLPLQEDFDDGEADHIGVRSGSWDVITGRLVVTPTVMSDGIGTLRIDDPLPTNLELRTTINADDRSADRFSNAFAIFDYAGPTDFKFAGAFVGANEWVIGHRNSEGWIVDAVFPATTTPATDYHVRVLIEDDSDVTLFVDGIAHLSHSYAESLTDGELGLGTQNAISRFDDLIAQAVTPTPPATLPLQEDFEDGEADDLDVRTGSWRVAGGRLNVAPNSAEDGISTLRIGDPLPGDLELQTTINADAASPNRFSNAFVILDYVGPANFKFAGAFVGADQWVIGHRDATGWIVDAVLPETIEALTDYRVGVLIEGGSDVTLLVDGKARLGHSFADSLTDGALGLGTQNAICRFDDLIVRAITSIEFPLPLHEDFLDDAADDVRSRMGSWSVSGGQLLMTPTEYQDGVSTLRIDDPLPTSLELQTTINANDRSAHRYSNAFVIFDYAGPTDFKFAGAFVGADEWVIGHRDTADWNVDAVFPATTTPATDYRVRVLIEDDSDITLFVDGIAYLSHSYVESLTNGALGLGTQNAISRFDDLTVQAVTPTPPTTLPLQEDFEDGEADDFAVRTGSWGVVDGRLAVVPNVSEDGVSTLRIGGPLPDDFELQTTINADASSPNRFSNAFVILDYVGPTDFKFAGAFVGANQWVIGHRNAAGWIVDAVLLETIEALTDFRVGVLIEAGSDVTLLVDGVERLDHSFADSLTDGAIGLGTQNAFSRFDDVTIMEPGQGQSALSSPPFTAQPDSELSALDQPSTVGVASAGWPADATRSYPTTTVDSALPVARKFPHQRAVERLPQVIAELPESKHDLTDRVFSGYGTDPL